MKLWMTVLALALSTVAAEAAGVSDYYGKWSRSDCNDDWMALAEGKVATFNKKFANIAPKPTEVPAKYHMTGDRLSVDTQERGRTPRREVYVLDGNDIMVLQDTFVDGRRIPSITRDHVTFKRCK